MKQVKQVLATLSVMLSGSINSHAGEHLSGKITFNTSPPMAAVIYVPGKTPEKFIPEIDQIDKQFTKKMVVASPQSQIIFKNSDQVEHNIFANDPTHGAKFDVGLMESGGEKAVPIDWEAESIVRIGCKIHPRMRAYIATVNASYHKIVEFDSKQSEYPVDLQDIPVDAEKVIVQIPKYDQVEFDIGSGNSWSIPITKNGRQRGEITLSREEN